jgi:hypothetical protein
VKSWKLEDGSGEFLATNAWIVYRGETKRGEIRDGAKCIKQPIK